MAQRSLPEIQGWEMRYLAEFLQNALSRTGDAGPLRAWAQGLLQLDWAQPRMAWVPVPISIPIRNKHGGLDPRTPFVANRPYLAYSGEPRDYRLNPGYRPIPGNSSNLGRNL